MGVRDFIGDQIAHRERDMRSLADQIANGTFDRESGEDLIAIGRYRQMKAERDRWRAMWQKREAQETSTMTELPDDEEAGDEPAQPERPTRRLPRRQARPWGDR